MAATTHPAVNIGSVVYMNGAMCFLNDDVSSRQKKNTGGEISFKKKGGKSIA